MEGFPLRKKKTLQRIQLQFICFCIDRPLRLSLHPTCLATQILFQKRSNLEDIGIPYLLG